jgi:hypothetical protein
MTRRRNAAVRHAVEGFCFTTPVYDLAVRDDPTQDVSLGRPRPCPLSRSSIGEEVLATRVLRRVCHEPIVEG